MEHYYLKKGCAYLNINEKIYYSIGDINLEIINDFPYSMPDGNAADFRTQKRNPDFSYIFKQVRSIPLYIKNTSVIDDIGFAHDLKTENGEIFRAFLWEEKFYDTVLKLEENRGTIYYLSANILAERFINGFNYINYLGLEQVISKYNGIVLHSSHIVIDEKSILFSAPSGTGKSTQAFLWENYENAKIINGDKTLLRKKNNTWHAYGCPMCGTSNIHLQGNFPIRAIIMLNQGNENKLSILSPVEAFSLIYPQITTSSWNQQLVLKNLELLEDLIANVPIYKYSCTKEKEAVTTLKNIILQ